MKAALKYLIVTKASAKYKATLDRKMLLVLLVETLCLPRVLVQSIALQESDCGMCGHCGLSLD
jgi:hypothetical protein